MNRSVATDIDTRRVGAESYLVLRLRHIAIAVLGALPAVHLEQSLNSGRQQYSDSEQGEHTGT